MTFRKHEQIEQIVGSGKARFSPISGKLEQTSGKCHPGCGLQRPTS